MTCISERKHHPNADGSGACAKVQRKPTRKRGPRRITRRREIRVSQQKRLAPMEQLPPAYIVSSKKQARRTPELYYCISVSNDTLYNYAVKHDLIPNLGFANAAARQYCGRLRAVRQLKELSGGDLVLQFPRWTVEESSSLVAYYSNHSHWHHVNVAKGPSDEHVFDIVRRELAITSTPKWYHTLI